MKYRNRLIERRVQSLAKHFPVVLVVGARQVGKTTLVRHLFGDRARSFVFDPVHDPHGAREDPELFLSQHPPPLILDEAQYAPGLLPVIKRRVDEERGPGQYILTGSQNLALLRQVSESLAGRVGVVELAPLSHAEACGQARPGAWLEEWLSERHDPVLAGGRLDSEPTSIARTLWRGGFPGLLDWHDELVPEFFDSYIRTYVERDVRVLADLRALDEFTRFLGLCGALTAQEVNRAQLGRDVNITPQTSARWLELLQATFLWHQSPAYSGNVVKRLSQKPKGYLADTGLAAHLQRLPGAESLEVSPLLGALFETHVVAEIRKLTASMSPRPALYHWRTHGGAEVDLLLDWAGKLWPIEIKRAARVSRSAERGFRALRETYPAARFGPNLIIAAVEEARWLSRETMVMPFDQA
jgi:uncharacterized protein